MSDGITDAYRDAELYYAYERYIQAIADYVANPSLGKDKVCQAAKDNNRKATDEQTSELLDKLVDQDETTWLRLLGDAISQQATSFEALKAASPYADQIIVTLAQGYGFQTHGGEIHRLLRQAQKQAAEEAKTAGRFAHQKDAMIGNFVMLFPKDCMSQIKGFKFR